MRNKNFDIWLGIGLNILHYRKEQGLTQMQLAESAGYKFEEGSSPAEKLKVVQKLMENGDDMARKIYEDIGVYLGYAIPYYSEFYKIKHLLLLGRVTSGEGGAIIVQKAKEVLNAEFPEFADINITMPDESNKRVGQSIAAASLPEIK